MWMVWVVVGVVAVGCVLWLLMGITVFFITDTATAVMSYLSLHGARPVSIMAMIMEAAWLGSAWLGSACIGSTLLGPKTTRLDRSGGGGDCAAGDGENSEPGRLLQ